jgi:D-xylose transport system substrate-binding protein
VAAVAVVIAAVSAVPMSQRVFASSHQQAAITGKIGFLFSDFTTSARWQFDKQYFLKDLHKLDPAVSVIVTDAKAVQTNQQNQAKSDLTRGVKALIDVPVDSAQAALIVKAAHAEHPRVPVLAYDRLITGAFEDAYASFDGYSVGVQQAKYLVAHVAKGSTIVEIAGAPTDNNAHLFHNGARSVLDPLINSGYYKLGYFKFTPDWNDATAQQEMAAALTSLNNKVQGVLSANDGMAGGIITALTAQHLNGKVVVTGQDATVAGLQQILLGNQSMSVYKPLKLLAGAAANIVNAWLHHKVYKGNSPKTQTGAGGTPTFLAKVETVTANNLNETVIKDGFVTKSALCNGIPASACAKIK